MTWTLLAIWALTGVVAQIEAPQVVTGLQSEAACRRIEASLREMADEANRGIDRRFSSLRLVSVRCVSNHSE